MKFLFEERSSDSPLIEKIWRTQGERPGTFISQAAIHSEIVVTRYKGKTSLTVRGPETKATLMDFQWIGAEFFGIVFKLGTFIPHLPPGNLRDLRNADLPEASSKSFWLQGSTWQFPDYENADTFVERLTREGLLVRDPVVDAVVRGHKHALSLRSIQYRFSQATGLTLKVIQQIERARHAATLLEQGVSILDVVYEAGYFDQPHLTRSLKRFLGQTPAQVARVSQPE